MRIVVCLKVVPKPDEVRLDLATRMLDRGSAQNVLNPADKNALEMSLDLRERYGGEVTVLSMGPPLFEPYLGLALAMGADRAVLLSDRSLAGADTLATSYALARAVSTIGDVDLVLTGEESADAGTGQVPPGIAEWLGWSQITYARALTLDDEGWLLGERTVESGRLTIRARLPCVVSIETGANEPRFPDFERKRALGDHLPIAVWDARRIEADPDLIGLAGSRSLVSDLVEREPPGRKRQMLDGPMEEQVRQLLRLLGGEAGALADDAAGSDERHPAAR